MVMSGWIALSIGRVQEADAAANSTKCTYPGLVLYSSPWMTSNHPDPTGSLFARLAVGLHWYAAQTILRFTVAAGSIHRTAPLRYECARGSAVRVRFYRLRRLLLTLSAAAIAGFACFAHSRSPPPLFPNDVKLSVRSAFLTKAFFEADENAKAVGADENARRSRRRRKRASCPHS
eukprot:2677932-Rhodomonas_salina.3